MLTLLQCHPMLLYGTHMQVSGNALVDGRKLLAVAAPRRIELHNLYGPVQTIIGPVSTSMPCRCAVAILVA